MLWVASQWNRARCSEKSFGSYSFLTDTGNDMGGKDFLLVAGMILSVFRTSHDPSYCCVRAPVFNVFTLAVPLSGQVFCAEELGF